jgi:hypothetical protein
MGPATQRIHPPVEGRPPWTRPGPPPLTGASALSTLPASMIHRRQAATALDEALSLLTLPPGPKQTPLVRLKLAWAGICGPLLARHCEPLHLENGRLVIGVGGADWREVLFQQRRPLQQRVRQVVAGIVDIRLVNRPGAGVPLPEAPPRSAPAPADPRTAEVSDAGLRSALDGLLAARQRRATE